MIFKFKDVEYYLRDHLGSSSFISDESGQAYQFLLYLPWGETMAEQKAGDWSTPYKYTGKELDEEIGMYDYGARFYDPSISLWSSVDPLTEKYFTHSAYNFVMNNPIMYVDPDGRSVDKIDPSDVIKNDKEQGTNYHGQLVEDLYNKTGVKIGIGKDGNWSVDSVDKKVGSKTARKDLLSLINNEETVTLEDNRYGGSYVPADSDGGHTNIIQYDGAGINEQIDNTFGVDNTVMGHAFTFLHESQHTIIGGELVDDTILDFLAPNSQGQTVKRVNRMRRELGLPERQSYSVMSAGVGMYNYIPFSKNVKKGIKKGNKPSSSDPHIRISKMKTAF